MKDHAKKCPRHGTGKRFPYKGKGCVFCDGYHTWKELYKHRYALFLALCRQVGGWRAKLHHDGTMFEDCFIVGIGTKNGEQVTYHLPMGLWVETEYLITLDFAPEFDGHTSDDVLERLKDL